MQLLSGVHRSEPVPSMDQTQTPYADALRLFVSQKNERLNTPGHQVSKLGSKKLTDYFGSDLLNLDIQPQVDGIDYGPSPTPLEQSLSLAAQAWGAHRTWFLTNGASMGNLIACLAVANLGKSIVVQRSVHSSVIDGLALSGLKADFISPSIWPELGIANGITPKQLASALTESSDCVAAYVVSPSYFGAVADIVALAEVAHSFGVPLIVDEAWGAHFGFSSVVPQNAIRLGADIVISSTHKLGGSLTQSAMLHLGTTKLTQTLEPLLERAYKSMESTSVSSLLLASLDLARSSLATTGEVGISNSHAALMELRDLIRTSGRFQDIYPELLQFDDVVATEPLRISLNTLHGGISGLEAQSLLRLNSGVYCEMATSTSVVMLVGAGSVPNVTRIATALEALPKHDDQNVKVIPLPKPGRSHMSVRDAAFGQTEIVDAKSAIGRISADSVAAYPPGIPNLLPGEEITAETLDFLSATKALPFGHVRGGFTSDLSKLRVVKN